MFDSIIDGGIDAFLDLIYFGILYGVYRGAYAMRKESNKSLRTSIIWACIVIGFISFFFWATYGTSFSSGGLSGNEEVDAWNVSFIPTEEQRLQHGVDRFVTFGTLIVLGIYNGWRDCLFRSKKEDNYD